MLPNVALRMPPTCGPVSEPSRSVDRPTTQASPRMRSAPTTMNRSVSSACSAEVEDDRDEADHDRRDEQDRRPTGDSWPRIGSRSDGVVGHRRSLSDAARRRRAGGAGCPVSAATCLAASPRADARRRRAARPRRAPPPGRRPRRPPRRTPRPARPAAPRRRARTRRGPGSRPSAAAAASSPSVPRTIVSWSFVSSRQTAAGRSPPQAAGQVAQRGRDPARRLEHDRRRARRRRSGASRSRRSRPDCAAGTPRTLQRGPATPGRRDRRQHGRRARDRHHAPALGRPRARPGRSPGSLTAGVPASVTSARSAPPRRCSSSAVVARRPLRAW